MDTVSYFKEKAAESRRLAATTSDEVVFEALIELAEEFEAQADELALVQREAQAAR